MELWVAKIISLFLILLLTIVFGLLPIRVVAWLRKCEENDRVYRRITTAGISRPRKVLGYMNCFSGGVFLGTCFLHLFPEVIEKYNSVISETIDYPLAELLIIGGFFLIMLIEHGAMSLNDHRHGHSHGHIPGHSHGHTHGHTAGHAPSVDPTRPEEQVAIVERIEDAGERDRMLEHGSQNYGTQDYGSLSSSQTQIKTLVEDEPDICPSLANSYASHYECNDQLPHHHHPGQTHEQTERIHSIRSLVLLLALSLHTVFEGLALGLETTEGAVWTLFAALAIHKSIIAFTVGLQLTDTFQQTTRVLFYMLAFSVVSPIGIAIGTAITAVNNGSYALDMSSIILQGLATGTFLYVTFFEVLQKELGVEEHSISKVLVIILGFGAISLTNLLEG